ncbi:hypothetical protein [Nocardia sp. NPDC057227]|uniref:hypothetical protein n=1 Tax=Nocardia sp. NPDC057227 TaxID=3346056 RepID=UPI0036279523
MRDEVERTDVAIRAAGYTGEITFRPPYGKKFLALPRYLAEHGRTTVMWDVEPESSAAADIAAVRDRRGAGRAAADRRGVARTGVSVRPGVGAALILDLGAYYERDTLFRVRVDVDRELGGAHSST